MCSKPGKRVGTAPDLCALADPPTTQANVEVLRRVRALMLVLALLAITATAFPEPLQFADWTIPVAEGTRIVEYPAPSIAEREGKRIELAEDLVIEARGDDTNYLFYRPTDIEADAEGRIYVADSGNTRVQVFDAGGEYLRTLGRQGQGPGEFGGGPLGQRLGLIVAGDRIVVNDPSQRKIAVFASSGAHIADHSISASLLVGLADGSFLSQVSEFEDDGTRYQNLVRFSAEGAQIRTYISLSAPSQRVGNFVGIPGVTASPSFAAAREGEMYATGGDEYQVFALDTSGAARWALRVARERQAFTDEHEDRVVSWVRGVSPEDATATATGTVWPSHLPALSHLAIDGHGHLYVFPFEFRFGEIGEQREVDVYSPDGERLFPGYMDRTPWSDADGDFVYALRTNEETGEQEPVRYRLIEPF
jgi:outer membrane protein assembly factor BamB